MPTQPWPERGSASARLFRTSTLSYERQPRRSGIRPTRSIVSGKSELDCLEDKLGAVSHLELLAHGAHMKLDGGDVDVEPLGNFLVGQAFQQLLEHLAFAFGQAAVSLSLPGTGAGTQGSGGQKHFACQDQLDCTNQRLSGHAFGDIALGPHIESLLDFAL